MNDERTVERRLGPARAKTAHAWRALHNAGARLDIVSDWPGSFNEQRATPLAPLRNIALAIERGWHPDEALTMAKLARRAAVSRRTMERLFLAETRMTVGEWRRRVRLLHAVHRLAGGESVTSAALDAGYSSTSAFISVFRKAFGTTPGRYGPRRGTARE